MARYTIEVWQTDDRLYGAAVFSGLVEFCVMRANEPVFVSRFDTIEQMKQWVTDHGGFLVHTYGFDFNKIPVEERFDLNRWRELSVEIDFQVKYHDAGGKGHMIPCVIDPLMGDRWKMCVPPEPNEGLFGGPVKQLRTMSIRQNDETREQRQAKDGQPVKIWSGKEFFNCEHTDGSFGVYHYSEFENIEWFGEDSKTGAIWARSVQFPSDTVKLKETKGPFKFVRKPLPPEVIDNAVDYQVVTARSATLGLQPAMKCDFPGCNNMRHPVLDTMGITYWPTCIKHGGNITG